MSNDDLLTIGTEVDISALNRAMAEAQLKVRAATADMSDAYKAFGAAARAGSQEAQDVLVQYQTRLNSARADVRALEAAQREAATATRETAAAQTAAAAAAQEQSAALAEDSAATQQFTVNTTEARFAAQLFGREVGVAIPRALSSVAASSAALGPVLQVLFPVIAAFAFAEVIGSVIGKLEELYDEALNYKTLQLDIFQGGQKDAEQMATLMESEIRLRKDAAKKDNPVEGYKEDIEEANRGLEGLQLRLKQIREQVQATKDTREKGSFNPYTNESALSDPQRLALEQEGQEQHERLLQQQVSTQQAMIADLNSKMQKEQRSQQKQQESAAREAANKHNQVVMQGYEQEFADLQQTHLLSVQDELAFWAAKNQAAEQGSTIYRETGKKTAELYQRYLEEQKTAMLEHEKGLNSYTHALEKMMAADDKDSRAYQFGQRKRQLSIAEQNVDESHSEAQAGFERRGIGINGAASEGTISPEAQLAALRKLHADELKEEKEYLAKKIELMKQDPDADRVHLNKLQNELKLAPAKASIVDASDQQKQLKLVTDTFRSSFNQMNQEFNSSIDGWLRGTERFSQAFTRMADNMAITFTNNLLKEGEQWIQKEAMKLAVHTATNTGIATQDAAATAESTALSAQSSLQQITHLAALSAAKAYSAVAGIPIVGPILAPIAAGAAFVAVEALAAFDKGTSYIPRDGVAMLHRGEAVLPPPQTQALNDALSGRGRSGGRGGDNHNHFHFSPNVSAMDGQSVAAHLGRSGQEYTRFVEKQLRLRNLSQRG